MMILIKILWDLIKREMRIFASNTVMLAIFIGAPVFFGLILGFVYQQAQPDDLPVMVVDYDNSPLSNQVIDALEDNQYLTVSRVLNDNQDVQQRMQRNIDNAVINIPSGFEGDIQQKRYPEIEVELNTANILTANYAARGIQHVLGTINAGIEIQALNKKGVPLSIAKKQYESFKVNITRFFNPGANYLEFLWPGILAAVLQQVYLLVMALSFSREFEKNTFSSLVAKTESSTIIMLAKSLPYWFTGMLLWYLILEWMFPLFKLPVEVNSGALFVISTLFILAATFIGILISLIIPSQLKATEILMIVASPGFILSGFTWPLSEMPVWVQNFAKIIPLTPFLNGFRKIFMLDGNMFSVYIEILNLIILTGFTLLISWIILKTKIKNEVKKQTMLS